MSNVTLSLAKGYGITAGEIYSKCEKLNNLTFEDLERFCGKDESTENLFLEDIETYYCDMEADETNDDILNAYFDDENATYLGFVKKYGNINDFMEHYSDKNDHEDVVLSYLAEMINSQENIQMQVRYAYNEYTNYLLFPYICPWAYNETEKIMTAEKIREIITKYVSELAGEQVKDLCFDDYEPYCL
ncbi:hypothetical protein IKQ26_05875 [bacterium]|nr:hypothetical protein [bacterium]